MDEAEPGGVGAHPREGDPSRLLEDAPELPRERQLALAARAPGVDEAGLDKLEAPANRGPDEPGCCPWAADPLLRLVAREPAHRRQEAEGSMKGNHTQPWASV